METVDLSNCPEPWYSFKKRLRKFGSIGLPVVLVLSYLFYNFISNDIWKFLPIWLIFICFTLFFAVAFIKGYFEKKDAWMLKLPFNRELFRILNEEIELLLKNKKIEYNKTDRLSLSNSELSKSFEIEIPYAKGVRIDTMLTFAGKSRTPISNLEIVDIRPDNFLTVLEIQRELIYILNKLNYKEFPSEY